MRQVLENKQEDLQEQFAEYLVVHKRSCNRDRSDTPPAIVLGPVEYLSHVQKEPCLFFFFAFLRG